MQADIKLLRSFDGGTTWSNPRRVNQDNTNADQFQPYVRVTRRGQVNVSFFDRRLDTARPAEPPGQLLHRHVPRAVQQRREHVEGDPALARLCGIRRSTRRSPGRASSSATTRGWSPTTATRSRSSTTPTWPTIRVATRTSTGASRAARIQEIIAWRVPNTRAFGGMAATRDHGHCRRGPTATPSSARAHRRQPRDDRPVVEASDPAEPAPRVWPAWPRVTARTARSSIPGRRPHGRRPVPCLLGADTRVAPRERLLLLPAVWGGRSPDAERYLAIVRYRTEEVARCKLIEPVSRRKRARARAT